MNSRVLAIVLWSVALAWPPAAPSQQVPSTLTLDDALALARRHNPEYRQVVNRVDAAEVQVRAGWGAFLPTLSAGLSFSGFSSTTVTGQDDFGRPVALPDPIEFEGSSTSQSLLASLTLFDGLSRVHTYRAARVDAAAAESAVRAAEFKLVAETTRRFYDAARAERLIEVEERLLASAREQLANTERLFRVAGATREDLLGAQADVAGNELAVARARGEARKARLALKEYLGVTEDIEFTVVGEPPAVLDPATLDADSLVALALAASPEVRQLEARTDAAALRASAARGERLPRLQLTGWFSRSMSLTSYEALFRFNPQNRGFGFGLSLDWPLFRGFGTAARISAADVEARNAEQALRAGRLALERRVRSALIDLENAYRSLELAERAAALSAERLRLARERYAIGDLDFTRLQLVIAQAAQAERELVTARFEVARAVATLEEAVGTRVAR